MPSNLEELKALPAVGDYVAAAVQLFAFGKPVPLIDVNTSRVLFRLFHGRDPPKRYMSDKEVRRLAKRVEWNREVAYALIDFAAAVCLPRNPNCAECPANRYCAYPTLQQQPKQGCRRI